MALERLALPKSVRKRDRTFFERAIAEVFRRARTVIGPTKTGSVVSPELEQFVVQANLQASILQMKIAELTKDIFVETANLQDQLTDIVGKLGRTAGIPIIDDLQELLDFPIRRVAEGMAVVVDQVIKGNEVTIKRSRKFLKENK